MSITKSIYITPSIAKEILSKSINCRPLRDREVAGIARDMEADMFTPYAMIGFNSAGNLVDGFHRLNALVKAGKSYWFTFKVLSPDEVFRIDGQATPRTIRDVLQAAGDPIKHRCTEQVIKWVYRAAVYGGCLFNTHNESAPAAIQYCNEERSELGKIINEVYPLISEFAKLKMGTKNHVAFIYVEAHRKDPGLAYELLSFLTNTTAVSGRSSFVALKDFLCRDKNEKNRPNLKSAHVMNAFQLVWNNVRSGDTPFKYDGLNKRVKAIGERFVLNLK